MAETEEKDDKTEEPTARKLEKAIEKGDVPRSVEVGSWMVLSGGAIAILFAGSDASRRLAQGLAGFLGNAHAIPVDPAGLAGVTLHGILLTLAVLAVPFALVALAGIAGALIQNPPLFTTEPLTPKLERISPFAGFKRIFGVEALVNFLKGFVKIVVVTGVILAVLWPHRDRFESVAATELAALPPLARDLTLQMLGAVLALYLVIALADTVYQRLRWAERQRMSRRELKDEFKETEGSPEIKARIKQLRAAAARRRMMAAVPKATVVIMNPTHYAVALSYERGMEAPVCVAKGVDSLALRIRDVAQDAGVPVVENAPLARALHASVAIDAAIDPIHYRAVADVIGFVMRLRRRA